MSITSSRVNLPSAVFAGAAASAVYAGEMYLDIALTGNPLDDVQLLEGALRGRKAQVPLLGMLVHLLNGSALAVVYALVKPLLPGPNWLKGDAFRRLFLVAVLAAHTSARPHPSAHPARRSAQVQHASRPWPEHRAPSALRPDPRPPLPRLSLLRHPKR